MIRFTAWFLTELAARGGDVEAAGYPVAYVPQVAALRERRAPAMGVGELAEVTRASGARSVWRCSNEGWELVHRESAAEVARRPPPAVGPDPEAIIEAER